MDQAKHHHVKGPVGDGLVQGNICTFFLPSLPQVKQGVAVREAEAVLAGPARRAHLLPHQPGRRVQDVPPVVLGGSEPGPSRVTRPWARVSAM